MFKIKSQESNYKLKFIGNECLDKPLLYKVLMAQY